MLFALLVLERDHALSRERDRRRALAGRGAVARATTRLRALLTGVRRVFGPDSIDGRDGVRLLLPEGRPVDVEDARPRSTARRGVAGARRPRGRGASRSARDRRPTSQELLAGLSAPWIDERRAAVEELCSARLEIEAHAALAAGRAGRRRARGAPDSSSARRTASPRTRC